MKAIVKDGDQRWEFEAAPDKIWETVRGKIKEVYPDTVDFIADDGEILTIGPATGQTPSEALILLYDFLSTQDTVTK